MYYSHMAEHVRSKGRGDDTMLVHMTPHEVGGLQALAMAHGGSLTINPETGLPEAGWLGKLLPTILGFGLNFIPGVGPLLAAGVTALGTTAITGNLKEGLMAGLGAFGGASLSGGLFAKATETALAAAAPAASVVGSAVPTAAIPGSTLATGIAVPGAVDLTGAGLNAAGNVAAQGAKTGLAGLVQNFGGAAKAALPSGILQKVAVPAATAGLLNGVSGALTPTPKPGEKPIDEYGYTGPYTVDRQEIGGAMPTTPGALAQFDPTKAYGTQRWFGGATIHDASGNVYTPGMKTTPGGKPMTSIPAQPMFNNPNLTPEQLAMLTQQQQPMFADGGQVGANQMMSQTQTTPQPAQQMMDGSYSMQVGQPQQTPYMQPSAYGQPQQNNPVPDNSGGIKNLPGLASGGTLHMRSGSFVMPARETAEFGNGSSGAGQQVLARLGGTPIHGPGDGVSDSIPAHIDGRQKARVARDEVHFSPEAVARLGGGNHKRGTQKLYALMDKAQKSRKSAKRGQDTGLRAIA